MNREDLISNLGTIAAQEIKNFIKSAQRKDQSNVDLIVNLELVFILYYGRSQVEVLTMKAGELKDSSGHLKVWRFRKLQKPKQDFGYQNHHLPQRR